MASPSERPEELHLAETRADDIDITKADGYDTYGLVKSRFDELSILGTLWVFKRVTFISLAVYTGYICEGFEVSDGPLCCRYIRRRAVLVTARGLYGTARRWRQYCRKRWVHQAVRYRGWCRREGT